MVPEGCLQESSLLKKMAWLILCIAKRVSFRLDTRRVCKLIVPLRAHFSLEKLNCFPLRAPTPTPHLGLSTPISKHTFSGSSWPLTYTFPWCFTNTGAHLSRTGYSCPITQGKARQSATQKEGACLGPRAHCSHWQDASMRAVFIPKPLSVQSLSAGSRDGSRVPFLRLVFFPSFCWTGRSGKTQHCLGPQLLWS